MVNVLVEQWDSSIFDVPESVCYQKTVDGLIPYEVDPTPHSVAYFLSQDCSSFGMGGFSQEIGICEEEKPTKTQRELPAVRSTNLYNDICAQVSTCLQLAESSTEATNALVVDLLGVMTKFLGEVRVSQGQKESLKGKYVSMYSGFDKRQKGKRLKSASEPKRRKIMAGKTALTLENSVL